MIKWELSGTSQTKKKKKNRARLRNCVVTYWRLTETSSTELRLCPQHAVKMTKHSETSGFCEWTNWSSNARQRFGSIMSSASGGPLCVVTWTTFNLQPESISMWDSFSCPSKTFQSDEKALGKQRASLMLWWRKPAPWPGGTGGAEAALQQVPRGSSRPRRSPLSQPPLSWSPARRLPPWAPPGLPVDRGAQVKGSRRSFHSDGWRRRPGRWLAFGLRRRMRMRLRQPRRPLRRHRRLRTQGDAGTRPAHTGHPVLPPPPPLPPPVLGSGSRARGNHWKVDCTSFSVCQKVVSSQMKYLY